MKVTNTETHQQTIRAHIDRKDLEKLLVNAVSRKAVGVDLFDKPGVKWSVDIQEVREGSPGHKVGDQATVTITVDMGYQPTAADPQS
jgi:hypothetical protein